MHPLDRPLVLGHRGARLEAPENTLPAFRRALELGADGVELDARLTADGQVIVFHDDTLERTTDGQGPVARTTLDELRQLDAGRRFGQDFPRTPPCTLAEALAVLQPARLVNVELKGPAGDGRLPRAALGIVRQAGMLERVVFSSFAPAHLRRLRRLDRTVALAWLYDRTWLGPLAFLCARILRLQALHPGCGAVSAGLVRQAHRRGLRVLPWTINEEDIARTLVRWGADGLITDRPGEVRRWLEATSGQLSADR